MSETSPESSTVTHDVDDRTLTETVAYAVASARDVDVLDLPPLGDVLDAGALERLCRQSERRRSPTDVLVSFSYADCHVSVEAGETVTVSRADAAGD